MGGGGLLTDITAYKPLHITLNDTEVDMSSSAQPPSAPSTAVNTTWQENRFGLSTLKCNLLYNLKVHFRDYSLKMQFRDCVLGGFAVQKMHNKA